MITRFSLFKESVTGFSTATLTEYVESSFRALIDDDLLSPMDPWTETSYVKLMLSTALHKQLLRFNNWSITDIDMRTPEFNRVKAAFKFLQSQIPYPVFGLLANIDETSCIVIRIAARKYDWGYLEKTESGTKKYFIDIDKLLQECGDPYLDTIKPLGDSSQLYTLESNDKGEMHTVIQYLRSLTADGKSFIWIRNRQSIFFIEADIDPSCYLSHYNFALYENDDDDGDGDDDFNDEN